MGSTHSRSAAKASDAAPSSYSGRNAKKYFKITDQYQTLEQVQKALREAGLESSNLILGIDFTKSNEWSGKHSFEGRSLHATEILNPYDEVIRIIGKTLSKFDDDNLIPCFGFGDGTTHDHDVFSFFDDNRPCNGFEHALERYREILRSPHLKLSGPTSFAPIINAAVKTVEDTRRQYHVLLIIADGQVTRSVGTKPGDLSIQEQATIDAIVAASDYPLSIVVVGVGDGPWDMMQQFDDNIPARAFDNFQFVKFTDIMRPNMSAEEREALFALGALMEIPEQYKATMELKLLGRDSRTTRRRAGQEGARRPLPPPQAVDRSRTQGANHEFENRFANRGEVDRFPSHRSPGSEDGKHMQPEMQPIFPYAPQASFRPQPHRHGERSTENNSNNQQTGNVHGDEGVLIPGRSSARFALQTLEGQNAALFHLLADLRGRVSELQTNQSRGFSEVARTQRAIRSDIMHVKKNTEEIEREQTSLLTQIQNFERFSVAEKDSSIPRFVYVTKKGNGSQKWWIELTNAKTEALVLRFLCEKSYSTGTFHEVLDQEGIDVSILKEWAKVLLPMLVWTLKAGFVASKIAGNVVLPGLGLLFGADTELSHVFDKIFPMTQEAAELSKTLFDGLDAFVINRALKTDAKVGVDEGSNSSSSARTSWVPDTEQQLRGDAKDAVRELLYTKMSKKERKRQVGLRRVSLKSADGDGAYHLFWICEKCCKLYQGDSRYEVGDLPVS